MGKYFSNLKFGNPVEPKLPQIWFNLRVSQNLNFFFRIILWMDIRRMLFNFDKSLFLRWALHLFDQKYVIPNCNVSFLKHNICDSSNHFKPLAFLLKNSIGIYKSSSFAAWLTSLIYKVRNFQNVAIRKEIFD